MYKFYNAHPKGLSVGDCVKRAITVAFQLDYMEVQRELNRYKKVTGARAFNTDYNPHRYVEEVLHGRKISFPAVKGEPRMNGTRFCQAYPRGRYILNMAGHWTCCIDGVIYDTWDCSEKCVYTAYEATGKKCCITPKKQCFVVEEHSSTISSVTIYDGNGKSSTTKMKRSMVEGYTTCLKQFGFNPYVSL